MLKFMDLLKSGKLPLLFSNSIETFLFWLEIIIGTIIPIVLLVQDRIRLNRIGLFVSSCFVIGGFLLNRMNVSITSLNASSGVSYFPSFYEITITLFIVTTGVIIFNLTVQYFPVFEKQKETLIPIEFEIITDEVPLKKIN